MRPPSTTTPMPIRRRPAAGRPAGQPGQRWRVALAGEGGLLESALGGELTDHLGYDCHGPAERDSGDSRDGHRSETVLTDVGAVQVD
jgi:hypothetical protein